MIAVGAILLMMPFSMQTPAGAWHDPLQTVVTALFTATSGVCVTGLSVIDVGTYYSFWGQLILLSLIQVGALGYMTATTLLLMIVGRRMGLKSKVALQQTLDTENLGDVGSLLRSVISTMVLFQMTGILLMMPAFLTSDRGISESLWLSIFHSVNGFNNAGFSLFSNSLVDYATSPLVNLAMSILIIFGGLGYEVIIELYNWLRHRLSGDPCRREFSLHFKVVTSVTLVLLVLGTVFTFVGEFSNPQTLGQFTFPQKLLVAWFQSVTDRTAGFNSIEIGEMARASLFITAVLMFIGASPGSTGGGIKTTTLRILLNCTRSALRGRDEVLCYQRKIPDTLVFKAVGVVVGSVTVVSIACCLISAFQSELAFGDILFETVSGFATVGLSTGITSSLSVPSRLVVIVTMYIGRVGVLLLMLAFLGDPPKLNSIEYPEEHLLVG